MRQIDRQRDARGVMRAVRAAGGFVVALLTVAFATVPALAQSTGLRVSVRNELDASRGPETVSLPAAELKQRLGATDLRRVHVGDEKTGQELLSQPVDDDGDGNVDALVFQADFGPRESKTFRLALGERRALRKEDFRVYGRFVRERFDDFAWENDRVAFRAYGAALETWKDEPLTSSAIDVWVKRTRRLVVNDWYMVDDYHRDTGEGADLYSAGKSRGCGGSGIWKDGRLAVSRNFRDSRVLAAGPIRLVFELKYLPWDAAGTSVSEVKRITLDAGSNLHKIESFYDAGGAELTAAAGIKKQPSSELRVERASGVMRTWEAFKDENGHLGCGIVVDPATIVDTTESDGNFLVIARAAPRSGPATYWAGFGWDKSGDFASLADWDRYLDAFARRARSPLRVEMGDR